MNDIKDSEEALNDIEMPKQTQPTETVKAKPLKKAQNKSKQALTQVEKPKTSDQIWDDIVDAVSDD